MIPFVRSITELMVITRSRDQKAYISKNNDLFSLTEDSGQRKRYIRSKKEETINLPELPRVSRRKWIKSKKAISRFLDELDYKNDIQLSYDITLWDRQKNYNENDVA